MSLSHNVFHFNQPWDQILTYARPACWQCLSPTIYIYHFYQPSDLLSIPPPRSHLSIKIHKVLHEVFCLCYHHHPKGFAKELLVYGDDDSLKLVIVSFFIWIFQSVIYFVSSKLSVKIKEFIRLFMKQVLECMHKAIQIAFSKCERSLWNPL